MLEHDNVDGFPEARKRGGRALPVPPVLWIVRVRSADGPGEGVGGGCEPHDIGAARRQWTGRSASVANPAQPSIQSPTVPGICGVPCPPVFLLPG